MNVSVPCQIISPPTPEHSIPSSSIFQFRALAANAMAQLPTPNHPVKLHDVTCAMGKNTHFKNKHYQKEIRSDYPLALSVVWSAENHWGVLYETQKTWNRFTYWGSCRKWWNLCHSANSQRWTVVSFRHSITIRFWFHWSSINLSLLDQFIHVFRSDFKCHCQSTW